MAFVHAGQNSIVFTNTLATLLVPDAQAAQFLSSPILVPNSSAIQIEYRAYSVRGTRLARPASTAATKSSRTRAKKPRDSIPYALSPS